MTDQEQTPLGPAAITDEQRDAYAFFWDGKTVADVVHEFAVERGDLSEQSARDGLTRLLEFWIDVQRGMAATAARAALWPEWRSMQLDRDRLAANLAAAQEREQRVVELLDRTDAYATRNACLARLSTREVRAALAGEGAAEPSPGVTNERGYHKKFRVERIDSSPRHPDCDYFVLDLTHDEHAAAALRAYANAAGATRPALARDLQRVADYGTDGESGARVTGGSGPGCLSTKTVNAIVYRCSLTAGHVTPHRSGDKFNSTCWVGEGAADQPLTIHSLP